MPELASLDVKLVIDGWEELQEKLDAARKSSTEADKAMTDFADRVKAAGGMAQTASERQFESMNKTLDKIGRNAKYVFAAATGGVLGFVLAGMRGTAQGEMLAFRMQMLSREVAGVFLPVIERAINYLQRITDWFRTLSQEQQESVMRWTLVTIAALGFLSVLPKIVSALSLIYAHPVIAGLTVLAGVLALIAANAALARVEMDQLKRVNEELAESQKEPTAENRQKQAKKLLEEEKKNLDDLEDQRKLAKSTAASIAWGWFHPIDSTGKVFNWLFGAGTSTQRTRDEVKSIDEQIEQAKDRIAQLEGIAKNGEANRKPGQGPTPGNRLMLAGGQFSSLPEAWRRGQSEVLRTMAEDDTKRQTKLQERIANATEATAAKQAGFKPAVVNQ